MVHMGTNGSPKACFETDLVFEKNVLSRAGQSSLPILLNSFRKPSLEERDLLWASFSCRRNDAESSSELIQHENDIESPSKLHSEYATECIKLRRRTEQDLEIEIDSSPIKSDQATGRGVGLPCPTPPSGPRMKTPSPKDLKEMKTLTKDPQERESPVNHPLTPVTPPTMPRVSQAPRYRRRLMTFSEIPSTPSSDELDSEQKAEVGADLNVGDFRQCPGQFWSKLYTKFNAKVGGEASCHPEPVVPKKTVPALTMRQLGSGQENEVSESWKRFELRKLKRKERSRSKNRLHPLDSPALSLWSTEVLRLCGRMTSQLAQPSEMFSHRSLSSKWTSIEEGRFVTHDESTAYRRWT